LEVHYHPDKVNVVEDALSHRHRCNHIMIQPRTTCCDPEESSLQVIPHRRLNNIALIPTIKEDVITAQCFRQDADGFLWFKDHLVIPKDFKLCRKIMDGAHYSRYSIHPRTNKMYQDLKKKFWWTRMK
jgi:hypothetical protein